MANHFYGKAVNAHYEKDPKDMKPVEWIVFVSMFIIFGAMGVCLLKGLWGGAIICFGVFFMMFKVLLAVAFQQKNIVVDVFFLIGSCIVLGGILVIVRGIYALLAYGILMYGVIWLAVGIGCAVLASRTRKKMREYSLEVKATCTIADVVRTNLFRFDDHHGTSYANPINNTTITKPAFQYYVNGIEYYTESTVYYGDLNKGFNEGAEVVLRVNPKNPHEILPKNAGTAMESFMAVFGIILGGGTFIGWGIAMVLGIIHF